MWSVLLRSSRSPPRPGEVVAWRATLREARKTGQSGDLSSLMEADSRLMEALQPE